MTAGVFRGGLAVRLKDRLVSNLLLPDRIDEYRALLERLARHGYRSATIVDFARKARAGEAPAGPCVLLRHDIDTDPAYVERWLAAEREAGFRATYYFRLRTFDAGLMQAVAAQGSEASYHYEEVATFAKRHGLRSAAAVLARIGEVRALFAENYARLKAATGLPLATVASHGDHVNRALGLTNTIVLEDEGLRARLGIEAEAYDPLILDRVRSRISDQMHPVSWRVRPEGTLEAAVDNGSGTIEILTHPRHWRAHWRSNVVEDVDRLLLAFAHRAGIKAGALASVGDRIK